MNKFIEEQLRKCKKANIIQKSDTQFLIQGAIGPINLELNKYYEIELENYIINPPPGFDLHINWNDNTHPIDAIMTITVIQKMGNMVKIQGTGSPSNSFWVGWIPNSSVKRAREVLI